MTAPPAGPGTYRILIVDDDEDVRILLMRAMAKAPFRIETAAAADGHDALDLIRQMPPHAIITDIMMPCMDGFELCAAVRADPSTAAIPIIVVTALEHEDERRRARALGADAYFTKPFAWTELITRLAELLERAYGFPVPRP